MFLRVFLFKMREREKMSVMTSIAEIVKKVMCENVILFDTMHKYFVSHFIVTHFKTKQTW